MSTRDKVARIAVQHGWTVHEDGPQGGYVRGPLRLVLTYGRRDQIVSGAVGTSGRPLRERGKYEEVVRLLTRWSAA